jgi:hypothetical protein
VAVPDSSDNQETFSKSGPQPACLSAGEVVAVAECSTHAVLDATIGGFKDSERTIFDELEAHIRGP